MHLRSVCIQITLHEQRGAEDAPPKNGIEDSYVTQTQSPKKSSTPDQTILMLCINHDSPTCSHTA